MEGNQQDWGGMLDTLSQVITPLEDMAVRRIASDSSIPSSLLDMRMHRCVAGLLVRHGITTWHHLHVSFPGERSIPSVGQENQFVLGQNIGMWGRKIGTCRVVGGE